MDTIRVLRVLEYVGPRAAVEQHLKYAMSANGDRTFPVGVQGVHLGEVTIKVATVGSFPEILKSEAEVGTDGEN